MEAVGFQRGLNDLLSSGVDVGVFTTDRALTIRRLMKEEYGQICHEGVMKKLVIAANKKNNQDLWPWLKSISNHLY